MHDRGMYTGLGVTIAGVVVLGLAWWLITHGPQATDKPAQKPPATVTLNESQLNVITLTSDALARLALDTAPAVRKPVTVARTFGGEMIVPPGHSIVVAAPV